LASEIEKEIQMSQMDSYIAYLENFKQQNPNVVKPDTDNKPDLTGSEFIGRSCKFWGGAGHVYKLANGGICESTSNTAGCQIYATWDKEEDYKNYKQAKCSNVFFDQW
jgi:hypothetical protein